MQLSAAPCQVELPAKTEAISCLVTSRLLLAAESGREAEMRNALRFAREKGMEKLGIYKEVGARGGRPRRPGVGHAAGAVWGAVA